MGKSQKGLESYKYQVSSKLFNKSWQSRKTYMLIADEEKAWNVVKIIYFQDLFPFTYDVWRLANINNNYPKSGHNIDNFKSGATVTIKFQILLQNFKVSKKVDIVKVYLFRLLGIYLVDNPVYSTMLTLKKRWYGEDK